MKRVKLIENVSGETRQNPTVTIVGSEQQNIQKSFDTFNDFDLFWYLFADEKETRLDFAHKLWLNEVTIRRWEQQIFFSSLIVDDYLGGRIRKNGLDKYQRFLILWIRMNKQLKHIPRRNRKNEYLRMKLSLFVRSKKLDRENFEKYYLTNWSSKHD